MWMGDAIPGGKEKTTEKNGACWGEADTLSRRFINGLKDQGDAWPTILMETVQDPSYI